MGKEPTFGEQLRAMRRGKFEKIYTPVHRRMVQKPKRKRGYFAYDKRNVRP
jgi:hypothetical protein